MKKVIALALALVMVLALCACGASGSTAADSNQPAASGANAAPASGETVELKLGHPLAPTSSQHIYLQKWADLVNEQSGGKYKITIYPSAQFGEARELVESLSMGVYDLAWCDTAVMDFLVPEINLINMPFFFDSYEQLWTALDGEAGAALCEIAQKAGAEVVGFGAAVEKYFQGGRKKLEALGVVRGSTVQSRNFGHDIMAGFRTLVGGEVTDYAEMLTEARQIATGRMVKNAEELGADAVVGMRYASASVMQGAAEVIAYGTAVKFV